MVCILSSAIISLSFSVHLSNIEHGKRKHFLLHPTAKICKYPGLLLQSCFFSYLMQLFSNYRRKTTWHYAHLHTSLGIYCYHYSGMILKPTKCTYFALKKPQKTFAGLTEWEQSARQELPCLPKIPVCTHTATLKHQKLPKKDLSWHPNLDWVSWNNTKYVLQIFGYMNSSYSIS